jgi:hypothetical protein
MTDVELARTYHRVFMHGDGQTVLDDLLGRFDARMSYVPQDTHGTAFREGQRAVVRGHILSILASVDAGEPMIPRV